MGVSGATQFPSKDEYMLYELLLFDHIGNTVVSQSQVRWLDPQPRQFHHCYNGAQ